MANLVSTTISGQLNVTQTGTSINASSNIFSGNILITQNAATGNLNVSTRSFEGNTNVYFTANVCNGNIIANSYQYNAPTSVSVTPGAGTTKNIGTVYMNNVANAMLVFSTYPQANNTKYNDDTPFQNHLGYRTRYMVYPTSNGANTSPTNTQCLVIDGGLLMNVWANSQTAIWPTNSSPIYKNSLPLRVSLGANNKIGQLAVMVANQNTAWSGSGAGAGNGGGFIYVSTFTYDTLGGAATRSFNGLSNLTSFASIGGGGGDLDVIANTVFTMLGVGTNTNSGNLFFIAGAAGSARTTTDLGNSFTLNTNDIIEVTIIVPPSGATIGYQVRNKSNGGFTQGVVTAGTAVPPANTFLQPLLFILSGTNACTNISILNMYMELLY